MELLAWYKYADFLNTDKCKQCSCSPDCLEGCVRNRINAKRPVIIDTDNHPVYYEHWIIAHGYSVIPGNGEYVIVNDGWEHNDVWLSADDSCLDDLIYFRN